VGDWIETKVGPSYQGVHRSFEDLGNGLIRVNIAVNASGAAISSVELRCDGRSYTVLDTNRKPLDLTLSCQTLDAHTTAFTFLRGVNDSWVKSAGTERVSEDGESMTVSAVQTDAKGRVVNRIERLFARRQGSGVSIPLASLAGCTPNRRP
jgi:hypothetical protein